VKDDPPRRGGKRPQSTLQTYRGVEDDGKKKKGDQRLDTSIKIGGWKRKEGPRRR